MLDTQRHPSTHMGAYERAAHAKNNRLSGGPVLCRAVSSLLKHVRQYVHIINMETDTSDNPGCACGTTVRAAPYLASCLGRKMSEEKERDEDCERMTTLSIVSV